MLVLTIHRLIPPSYLPAALPPGRLGWAQTARFGGLISGRSGCLPRAHARPGPPGPAACDASLVAAAVGATVLHRGYAIPTRKASSSSHWQAPETELAPARQCRRDRIAR